MKLQLAGLLIATLFINGCAARRHKVKVVSMIRPTPEEWMITPPAPPSAEARPEPGPAQPRSREASSARPVPVPQPQAAAQPVKPSPKKKTHAKTANPARVHKFEQEESLRTQAAAPPTEPSPAPDGDGFPSGLLVVLPLAAAGIWMLFRKAGEAV